jgi:ribulose-phosphate 3-epimerase
MPIKLCPSMMCADFGQLSDEMKSLELAGADMFHLDVMDGMFVPNFALGMEDVATICNDSAIPCDVHLMISNPSQYVEVFSRLGAEIIYIHPEADKNAARTLQLIRDAGSKPGIAVCPGTSFETVHELLNIVDYVLVMTVNPGFVGQKYLDFVDGKIDRFIDAKNQFDFEIFVDGACSPDRISNLSRKGVQGFVLGTSALFGKDESYKSIIEHLHGLGE